MATVEDLYRQVLGREPDAEGLAFWESAFGGSVDPAEQASFMQSVQSVLASAPPAQQAVLAPNLATTTIAPPAVTNEQILEFLKTPNLTDAQIATAMQQNGVTPAQLAKATGVPESDVQQRYAAVQPQGLLNSTQAPTAVVGDTPVATSNVPATVKDYKGKSYDSNTILSLARELAPTMNAKQLAGGVYSTQGESIGFNYDEATKLLGRPPSAAEQVVLDMARQLNQTKGITSLSQLEATDTSTRFGATYTGEGGTVYEIQKDPTTGAITTSTWGRTTSDKGNIVAALSIGAGLLGIPTQLGAAILGTGANTIAAGALGGGLFGGAAAGLTGGNILQGALLGAAGGAAGEYFKNPVTGEVSTVPTEGSVPFTGADYNLANSTRIPPGTDMGGATGFKAGTSANLSELGGARGITLNLGPASTTLANALSTFGGMNPANLSSMGGGQGLTYQTPTGLVTEGALIPTGGSTGNNDVVGAAGVNKAYNIGDSIGTNLAKVDTGVYNPSGGMLSSAVTGFNTDGTPVNKTTTTDTTKTTTDSILDKLTPGQIANIIAGVGGLVGGSAIVAGGGGSGGMGVGALPTQGVPLNTADYFNTIQQNYNRLLPAVPRDVATPLAQWYNSTYGA